MSPDASQSLVNLSPALQVMCMGLLLAMGPLAWVWLRARNANLGQRIQLLTLFTLFLTFDLVLFGAYTRLSDSGLGCPDWPGCYGQASPVGAALHIAQAQAAMPSGPVTHGKAWVEMLHRYLATGVGVLILTLAIAAWRERKLLSISPWWATFTLLWVCVQGAFGAFTVTWKLFPAIVTLHLLGGMALLALLKTQTERYRLQTQPSQAVLLAERTQTLLGLGFALLCCQIALGGWVSTNYAVLICNGFPSCQGQWWPAMDFAHGFELWRALGVSNDGSSITVQALTAIHIVHRLMAVLVLLVLSRLAWQLYRVAALRTQALYLAGLLLLQLATGLSNVVLDWPLFAALLHTGGAAAMVIVLTGCWVRTRSAVHASNDSHYPLSRPLA